MNDAEREERAIWKLEQASYAVRSEDNGYVVTGPDGAETVVADLVVLVEFADAVYERVWTGWKITPSA